MASNCCKWNISLELPYPALSQQRTMTFISKEHISASGEEAKYTYPAISGLL